ncbi:MAG: sulfotransferase family protein [Rhodobacteraceae bacterium]|nr:sulfotransferase family protein [Paracoccaceae bacterium]
MLVFWKQGFAFLANTKTGSTAIEAALEPLATVAVTRPPELKHMPAARFRRFMAPLLEKSAGRQFATVALMRDPVDWLGSWYRFRTREGLRGEVQSTAGLSFADFVKGYLADPPPVWADVGSQARFLMHRDGTCLVDRVFRYEAIGAFVQDLEERLDCEITLPRLNVSPEAPLDLPAGLAAALRARFAPDYALYDSLPV